MKNGVEIQRWIAVMGLLLGLVFLGCGGGESVGDESGSPSDILEDVNDDIGSPGDGIDTPTDPCPGLFDPATCEEVEVGSDVKGDFQMPCFDQDNDRYPDDAGDNPIYVDSSFHWFGEGDGSLISPFLSLSAATAAAGPNATIILARSDADEEVDGSYEGGFSGDALNGIRILGIGECDGDRSIIKHTGNGPVIALENTENILIQGLTVSSSNAAGIVITGTANGAVIHQNRFKDIAGDILSIETIDTEGLVIRDNEITKTLLPGCGIRINGGQNAVIEDNRISRVLGVGICAFNAEGLQIHNNAINENVGGGITLSNVSGDIVQNDLEENQEGAIGIAGNGTIDVHLNDIEDNEDSGVVISSTGAVSVFSNRIEGHAEYGVVVTGPNADLAIHHNNIGKGDGVGVGLFSDTEGIPAAAAPSGLEGVPGVYENEISDLRGAGIYVEGVPGVTLYYNLISDIESDGGHLGDGIAARNSAVLVMQGEISEYERFGVAFGDCKGDVREVTFEGVGANVACKANTCANISYTDDLPEIVEDPVPENYEPVEAENIIP